MNEVSIKPALLNEQEAARYISMSRAYLQKARSEGNRGNRTPAPPWIQIGRRSVRYALVDLDAWIAKHRIELECPDCQMTSEEVCCHG